MPKNNIQPDKITKPIQLLGAWLAGLFSLDASFLVAAVNMPTGSWEATALIIAAIVNVPLFLGAVFLLQTKFRPELQEDSYYSTYLSQKTDEAITIDMKDFDNELVGRIEDIESKILNESSDRTVNEEFSFDDVLIGINKHLSDRDSIKTTLSRSGVVGTTIFGADHPPKHRNVSISQYLSNKAAKEIIKMAREAGFESYNFFNNRAEHTEEDVLLGSYGEPEYEIIPEAHPFQN